MTVKDLIEVLQQCPNPQVPAVVRVLRYDRDEDDTFLQRCDVEDVRFDGGAVVIDAE